jgi:hypothetical protein
MTSDAQILAPPAEAGERAAETGPAIAGKAIEGNDGAVHV